MFFARHFHFLLSLHCTVRISGNCESTLRIYKPIFHCDAKYLASGVGVGQCTRRQNFALEIPTCWYILALPNAKICVSPDAKLKICVSTDASQWNIGGVGSSGVGHVYFMYISCIFHQSCIFHVVCASFSALATRKLADAKAVFSGIWAIESSNK